MAGTDFPPSPPRFDLPSLPTMVASVEPFILNLPLTKENFLHPGKISERLKNLCCSLRLQAKDLATLKVIQKFLHKTGQTSVRAVRVILPQQFGELYITFQDRRISVGNKQKFPTTSPTNHEVFSDKNFNRNRKLFA